jgi:hypothetical protein
LTGAINIANGSGSRIAAMSQATEKIASNTVAMRQLHKRPEWWRDGSTEH